MFKVIYIIYIHVSRLNKNLQSKRKETKRHMYMFILSQKTIKMSMSWASPELYLSSLPALCLCFMCPVVTKHTGGKRCDGVWEFAPVKRAAVALLDEGIHVAVMHTNFSLWHWTWVPGSAGHHRADAGHSNGSVTFRGMQRPHTHTNVQLARTISKMLGDILAACVYACFGFFVIRMFV